MTSDGVRWSGALAAAVVLGVMVGRLGPSGSGRGGASHRASPGAAQTPAPGPSATPVASPAAPPTVAQALGHAATTGATEAQDAPAIPRESATAIAAVATSASSRTSPGETDSGQGPDGWPSDSGPPLRVVQEAGPFGGGSRTLDSMVGNIYYLPSTTWKLPDFSTLRPVGRLYTREFNIPRTPFSRGFPGVDNRFEWFAISYRGRFTVARSGDYLFELASDDGSKLWIDGQLAVDNDGVHALQSEASVVTLRAGRHTMRLDYFQGPRFYIALQLFVTPPGGTARLWSPSF